MMLLLHHSQAKPLCYMLRSLSNSRTHFFVASLIGKWRKSLNEEVIDVRATTSNDAAATDGYIIHRIKRSVLKCIEPYVYTCSSLGYPGHDFGHIKRNQVIIVGSQARSGGSLLSRCFEDVEGGAWVYNQPEIFTHLVNDGSRPNRELLKRVLFLFCKAFWSHLEKNASSQSPIIVIKIKPAFPWLLKSFLDLEKEMETFFQMRFLVNYRNPVDSMKSSIK